MRLSPSITGVKVNCLFSSKPWNLTSQQPFSSSARSGRREVYPRRQNRFHVAEVFDHPFLLEPNLAKFQRAEINDILRWWLPDLTLCDEPCNVVETIVPLAVISGASSLLLAGMRRQRPQCNKPRVCCSVLGLLLFKRAGVCDILPLRIWLWRKGSRLEMLLDTRLRHACQWWHTIARGRGTFYTAERVVSS